MNVSLTLMNRKIAAEESKAPLCRVMTVERWEPNGFPTCMLLMRKMLPPTAIIGRAGNNRKDKADWEMKRKQNKREVIDFFTCLLKLLLFQSLYLYLQMQTTKLQQCNTIC